MQDSSKSLGAKAVNASGWMKKHLFHYSYTAAILERRIKASCFFLRLRVTSYLGLEITSVSQTRDVALEFPVHSPHNDLSRILCLKLWAFPQTKSNQLNSSHFLQIGAIKTTLNQLLTAPVRNVLMHVQTNITGLD